MRHILNGTGVATALSMLEGSITVEERRSSDDVVRAASGEVMGLRRRRSSG